jgi:hypothetical protein
VLFVYDLDLLVEHFAGKPIDGDVQPVTLFAVHDELRETCRIRWIVPGLRNHVDKQTPGPGLNDLGERAWFPRAI